MRRHNRPPCTEAGTLVILVNRRGDDKAWCGNCGNTVPMEWVADKYSTDARALPRYGEHVR